MAASDTLTAAQGVAAALAARNENVATEVATRVLDKALEAEREAAARVLSIVGLGNRLDTQA